MEERVNHPKYYNNGSFEVISIIRYYCFDIGNALKYLMRAGKKEEEGMSLHNKTIEDCEKALWYMEDYLRNAGRLCRVTVFSASAHPSGMKISELKSFFDEKIFQAIEHLWYVGLIGDGLLKRQRGEMINLRKAIVAVKQYIEELKTR